MRAFKDGMKHIERTIEQQRAGGSFEGLSSQPRRQPRQEPPPFLAQAERDNAREHHVKMAVLLSKMPAERCLEVLAEMEPEDRTLVESMLSAKALKDEENAQQQQQQQ